MNRLNSIVHTWRTDFDFKTFMTAGFSTLVTLVFAIGNAYLGIAHQSLWNGSICLYYFVLTIIRAMIIFIQDRTFKNPDKLTGVATRIAFRVSSLALIAMNLTLIVPISLMVELEKPLTMGLAPILAMTGYTFYRVILACVNFRKRTVSSNLLTRELRSINLMDALLAILTVQNALVSYKDTVADGNILVLTAVSSAVILVVIIAISIWNYVSGMREIRGMKATS